MATKKKSKAEVKASNRGMLDWMLEGKAKSYTMKPKAEKSVPTVGSGAGTTRSANAKEMDKIMGSAGTKKKTKKKKSK